MGRGAGPSSSPSAFAERVPLHGGTRRADQTGGCTGGDLDQCEQGQEYDERGEDQANDTTSVPASVSETVDGGVGYAYTQVGNNLNGRLARAALICRTLVPARTSWY